MEPSDNLQNLQRKEAAESRGGGVGRVLLLRSVSGLQQPDSGGGTRGAAGDGQTSKEHWGQENRLGEKKKLPVVKKTLSGELQPGSVQHAFSGCWGIRNQLFISCLVSPTASFCFYFRCVGRRQGGRDREQEKLAASKAG